MVLAGSQPTWNGSKGLLVRKSQSREGVNDKENAIPRSSQAGLVPGVKISASRAIGNAGEIVPDKPKTSVESGGHKVEDHVLKESAAQQKVAAAKLYQPFPARSTGSDCESGSLCGSSSGSDSDNGSARGRWSGSDSDNESASGSRSGSDSDSGSARGSASDNESASGSRSGRDSHIESASGSKSGTGSDTSSDGCSSSASKEEDMD